MEPEGLRVGKRARPLAAWQVGQDCSVIGFPETIILINILRTGLQSFSFAARALKGRGRGRVYGKEGNKTTDYTGRERGGGFGLLLPPSCLDKDYVDRSTVITSFDTQRSDNGEKEEY